MTTVFVYGTLKRGHGNWRNYLTGPGARFLGEAVSVGANYAMLDGSFPRVLDRKDGHPVLGELFEVDARVLKNLDRLEGHPRWYRRKRRMFRLADGSRIEAWVYIMQSAISGTEIAPERGSLAWRYGSAPLSLTVEKVYA